MSESPPTQLNDLQRGHGLAETNPVPATARSRSTLCPCPLRRERPTVCLQRPEPRRRPRPASIPRAVQWRVLPSACVVPRPVHVTPLRLPRHSLRSPFGGGSRPDCVTLHSPALLARQSGERLTRSAAGSMRTAGSSIGCDVCERGTNVPSHQHHLRV